MKFTGTSLKAVIANHRSCWTNELGYFIDGEQKRFTLSSDEEKKTYTLAENLPEGTHELLLFKRMDSCHTFTFYGFEIDDGAKVLELPEKPKRKMEFFGDSVSCGEVSEAVEYAGKPDPEHDGQYSNSWYSYAWMTARKLNAQIHDTSQGGISLLDDTGWFAAPHYKGVESCYDKIEYHPDLGPTKQWDFSQYIPNVVVVAIGQNDNHPVDYMAEDYDSEKSENWRKHYQAFIEKLMELYPKAQIILATTILCHDKNWDRSIDEVCTRIGRQSPSLPLHEKWLRHTWTYPYPGGRADVGRTCKDILHHSEMKSGNKKENINMEYQIKYENGIANHGNLYRLKKLWTAQKPANH